MNHKYCLDCNYNLSNIYSGCCPECGRAFDKLKPQSFYVGKPLNALHWLWAKPLSWSFAPLLAISAWMLYEAMRPWFYYMVWFVILLFYIVLLVPYTTIRVLRIGRVWQLWRKKYPKAWIREFIFISIVLLSIIAVVEQWTMRTAFLVSKPKLTNQLEKLRNDFEASISNDFQAGPFKVSASLSNLWNSRPDIRGDYFVFILADEPESGFIYSSIGIDNLVYNKGDAGHLWGDWYWMTQD